MIDLILISVAFLVLAIGTFTDFRVREVPDWVNYSGIFAGIGIRLLYSVSTFDWNYIIEGIFGFAVFFFLAMAMFYLGQWGGGDSKMLMGLGALLGLELRPDHIFVAFLMNMLFIGAAYGILWSIYLAVKHRKKFVQRLNLIVVSRRYKTAKIAVFALVALPVISSFLFFDDFYIRAMLISAAFTLLFMFYAIIFITAVEKTSLIKKIPVESLTEGDWIVRDVVVDRKKVCGPKDLGISREQIKSLLALKKQGKISKVLIKEGMPFVPAFLAAFVVSVIWGNLVLFFI